MTTVQIGAAYFIGGNIIKIAEKNPTNPGYNAHTWVKSKKAWTKKTSLYGDRGFDHWQLLTEQDVENLKA